MKVAVLGTGMVGRAHAGKLAELGHEVFIGTNNVSKTLNEKKLNSTNSPAFKIWLKKHPQIKLTTFAEAASQGKIVWEALNGAIALEVLKNLKKELNNKILIDISNPLDFSKGMPPTLFISNTDSLGEQIQRALPKVKVIKTFNTLNASLQVNPKLLANGNHDIFISGNDAPAKKTVTEILKSYGWKHIIDLGDITTSRGTEMMMPFWLRLWGTLKTSNFNYKIVKE